MAKELIKKKRKKWYPILASKEFRQVEIGETVTSSPDSLIGRTLEANLMQLASNTKKQNYSVKFKITEVKDDKAFTEVKEYYMSPSALKRLIFSDKEKIEDSFACQTKDKIKVRIKPLLITKYKTKKSVLKSLRKKTKEILTKEITNKTYSELINSFLDYKFINQIKNQLKKIYPLSTLQIKALIKQ